MRQPSERTESTLRKIAIVLLGCILFAQIVFALSPYFRSPLATRSVCACNLKRLKDAVQRWSLEQKKAPQDKVEWTDIAAILEEKVICLKGGKYTIGPIVSNTPTCSVHGHALTP